MFCSVLQLNYFQLVSEITWSRLVEKIEWMDRGVYHRVTASSTQCRCGLCCSCPGTGYNSFTNRLLIYGPVCDISQSQISSQPSNLESANSGSSSLTGYAGYYVWFASANTSTNLFLFPGNCIVWVVHMFNLGDFDCYFTILMTPGLIRKNRILLEKLLTSTN